MANISENLSTVKQSLIDIKNAIIDKGITPTGNITTYADAINQLCLCGESVEGKELCIENVGSSGTFSITKFDSSTTNFPNLELKLNNGEWFTYGFSVGGTTQITINAGDKLFLRGDNPNGFSTSITNSFIINCTFNYNISGYLTSLISTTDFNTITDVPNYCFFGLFNNQKTIINAKDLITENIINVGNSSFYDCFSYCSFLKTTPTFNNVVSVDKKGFRSCFSYCNNLTLAPTFESLTTVGESGFTFTFLDCQTLVTAPKFQSLTTINEQGFKGAFRACQALKNAPTFESLTTVGQEVFTECFQECTSLVTAPQFNNIEQANFNQFSRCFEGCTSLVNGPTFNNIKTAERASFYYCFSGCTSLVTAPQFPSLTEANDACFGYCFENCTSLQTAPQFPNLTSVTYSDQLYTFMYCFKGCTKLQTIYTPNISTWDENTFVDWVDGVASTGVLFKSESLEIPTGNNGIPTGWTTIIKN